MADEQRSEAARVLDGHVCLITGASKGIGRALAEGLADAGAKLVLAARNEQPLREVADGIAARGGEAVVTVMDVTDPDGTARAVEAAVEAFGRLDVAVANAGNTVDSLAYDLTPDEWDYVVDTNLKGAFLTAQASARQMRTQEGGGSIVMISSLWALVVVPRRSAYAAAKGGMKQLAKALAVEWAPDGIRVNAIAPTATITDINRHRFEDPEYRGMFLSRMPLGRFLEPWELVGPVAFLAGREAAMITGQTLYIDGGWSIK